MPQKMLIRKKILFSTLMLTFTLLLLGYCSLSGVYAYRHLTLMVEQLATELQTTSELRFGFDRLLRLSQGKESLYIEIQPIQRSDFRAQVREVDMRLTDYERQLNTYAQSDHFLANRSIEIACVEDMRKTLNLIMALCATDNADFDRATLVEQDVQKLVVQVQQLPGFILDRMKHFRGEVRSRYRALIIIIAASSLTALTIIGLSFVFFRTSVVKPFKSLLAGSRRIAKGDFAHRVRVDSHDELAELAQALNMMTSRFVEVQQNLNDKVKARTQEVVRSEQLASVGFLAAGVAHEINNPLASIAWSAEALESRLHEILHSTGSQHETAPLGVFDDEQIDILRKYLSRIQDEAFRCKGITERLLDFSRLGETQNKESTNVTDAIEDVIELVRHLGQYRNRKIEFDTQGNVWAIVSQTEIKQVALNLLTNSLDACDDGGWVKVKLTADQRQLKLMVTDNGCGMTEETQQHLFEPFYTRRRDGRGTGLGMSISYRIVQDHGGTLVPFSPGLGQGSTLTLTLPLESSNEEAYEGFQAAA